MDTYATINGTQEISWENWLLTQECRCGNSGIHRNGIPCEQHADNANNQVTVDDVTCKSRKT